MSVNVDNKSKRELPRQLYTLADGWRIISSIALLRSQRSRVLSRSNKAYFRYLFKRLNNKPLFLSRVRISFSVFQFFSFVLKLHLYRAVCTGIAEVACGCNLLAEYACPERCYESLYMSNCINRSYDRLILPTFWCLWCKLHP
jgi:hypothetical protein